MVIMLKLKVKSQMSTELVIISIAVLSLFVTMFAIVDYRNTEIMSMKQYLDAKDVADTISWNLNEIYLSGFGAKRFMYVVNSTSDGTPLNIVIYPKNRLVKVEWKERFYSSPLITSRLSGNISGNLSYNISLQFGRLNISNQLGEILLEQ